MVLNTSNRFKYNSKEFIVSEYLRIKKLLGRVPTKVELVSNSKFSWPIINKRFGSYKNLCNLFNDIPYFNIVTLDDIKCKYISLKVNLNRIPHRQELAYTSRMERKFGMTWKQFVEQMGDEVIHSSYTKEELKKIILDFNVENGRPPSSVEMKRPSSKVFQNMFGTWNNTLEYCGFSTKHPTYIANDGHKCYSRMELYVDNWLTNNNIKHCKDVYYPYHKEFNINTRKTCDWVLEDGRYVELYGLMRKQSYCIRVKEKSDLCLACGINLIELYPEDLKQLSIHIMK